MYSLIFRVYSSSIMSDSRLTREGKLSLCVLVLLADYEVCCPRGGRPVLSAGRHLDATRAHAGDPRESTPRRWWHDGSSLASQYGNARATGAEDRQGACGLHLSTPRVKTLRRSADESRGSRRRTSVQERVSGFGLIRPANSSLGGSSVAEG